MASIWLLVASELNLFSHLEEKLTVDERHQAPRVDIR